MQQQIDRLNNLKVQSEKMQKQIDQLNNDPVVITGNFTFTKGNSIANITLTEADLRGKKLDKVDVSYSLVGGSMSELVVPAGFKPPRKTSGEPKDISKLKYMVCRRLFVVEKLAKVQGKSTYTFSIVRHIDHKQDSTYMQPWCTGDYLGLEENVTWVLTMHDETTVKATIQEVFVNYDHTRYQTCYDPSNPCRREKLDLARPTQKFSVDASGRHCIPPGSNQCN